MALPASHFHALKKKGGQLFLKFFKSIFLFLDEIEFEKKEFLKEFFGRAMICFGGGANFLSQYFCF